MMVVVITYPSRLWNVGKTLGIDHHHYILIEDSATRAHIVLGGKQMESADHTQLGEKTFA